MARIVKTIPELRAALSSLRQAGEVGLVPTMGALHAGHVSLIDRARADCPILVVTIFVNPLQFDRDDDLRAYPRALAEDLELCSSHGVDLVFAPDAGEMYPEPAQCTIDVGHLADHLCGRFRPGHFRGVATVVMKLLQLVQPQRAYFGEKDAQQLAIIRRMVRDFNVPVSIVGMPTVREPDGLALSSRNRRLNERERAVAVSLYAALRDADRAIAAGVRDAAAVTSAAAAKIPAEAGLRLEYLDIVDPESMQPVASIDGPVRVAGALWVGQTRLIDNLLAAPPA
jgi:pantoate--beta-alanine ligase